MHELAHSIWNKKELREQWKESIMVPIYKKGDRTASNNYSRLTLPSTSCRILPYILLSSLSPNIEEIIGDQRLGFRHYQINC